MTIKHFTQVGETRKAFNDAPAGYSRFDWEGFRSQLGWVPERVARAAYQQRYHAQDYGYFMRVWLRNHVHAD